MQGQYQPRAPGIAAGQSARATTATYFDYQGIMRIALPGELRPNFVYQNGIWVQDGWLREGASTNYFMPSGTPTTVDGIQGVVDVSQTGSGFSPAMSAPSSVPAILSACIKRAPGTTGTALFWWGGRGGRPIVNIDPDNSVLSGNSAYYNATIKPIRDVWSFFTAQFNSVSADGWFPPWLPVSGFYYSIMLEYGGPTSWIPYGQTRGAD